jgi:hypothetical protein
MFLCTFYILVNKFKIVRIGNRCKVLTDGRVAVAQRWSDEKWENKTKSKDPAIRSRVRSPAQPWQPLKIFWRIWLLQLLDKRNIRFINYHLVKVFILLGCVNLAWFLLVCVLFCRIYKLIPNNAGALLSRFLFWWNKAIWLQADSKQLIWDIICDLIISCLQIFGIGN